MVHDPQKDWGEVVVVRKGGTPYNTVLDNGRTRAAACCKCFRRATQGACAGHAAEMHAFLFSAENALNEACGWAFDLGASGRCGS